MQVSLSLAALCAKNGRFSAKLIVIDYAAKRVSRDVEASVAARYGLGTNAMTNTASALGLGPGAGLAPLKAKWGWIVALGVVYLIAGIIALGSVVMATIASVYVVGIMMLIAGVFEVIHSFQIKSWGRFIFWLLLGVLYIIAGFVAFDNPLLTAVWLTLILGAALVASGLMRVFLGFNMQGGSPWIWVVVSGLITLLLGIIILIHWPVSSLWTLGIFLGVDLVFAGASWIGVGMGLHRTV